jgi:hypothetical protein
LSIKEFITEEKIISIQTASCKKFKVGQYNFGHTVSEFCISGKFYVFRHLFTTDLQTKAKFEKSEKKKAILALCSSRPYSTMVLRWMPLFAHDLILLWQLEINCYCKARFKNAGPQNAERQCTI